MAGATVIFGWATDDANYVSEGTIEIHIRVIVNADGFVRIATALEAIAACRTGLAGNIEFLGAVVTSIVLVCAVLASLAVGVLVAYGVCMAMFRAFQMHVRQVAEQGARRVVAPVQVVKS